MVSDGGTTGGPNGDGQTLVRRGADVLLVMNQSAAGGTDAGDKITMQNQAFLHAGMQRNVLNIFSSGGRLLNSVAGFAPGAI